MFPAVSVTEPAVGRVFLQTPTSTMIRLPPVMLAVGVTAMLATLTPCAVTFCTNAGGGVLDGVTALDGAEAGPVPMALVAVTVNVYVVPLVSPVMVVLVAGGDPVTVVGGCAVEPMNGV